MWEFIDKIIYINLDHRQDRRDIMSKFFEQGKIPLEKVVRFPAIKRPNAPLGCLESHTAVLRISKKNGWKNILVLEDDLVWSNFDEGYAKNPKYFADAYWNELIKIDTWYCIYPCLCYQVDGFSDNGGRVIESSKIIGIYDPKVRKDVYKH